LPLSSLAHAPKISFREYTITQRPYGRWVIVYSRNDIFGAWARDESGRFIYSCYPGGEAQRLEAVKITVNIVMYSLTGTYKKDIIHRDFIERKLKSW
ncbi:MAG: DUF4159 domain-containing protein, partial [Candidatus Omnitrophica bacterium]|nr:DUF4159 domain-containing protein [Candidatus Omnitrophota bacterium]